MNEQERERLAVLAKVREAIELLRTGTGSDDSGYRGEAFRVLGRWERHLEQDEK